MGAAVDRRQLAALQNGFGILCVLAEVFLTYAVYAGILKWLTLNHFACVAVVFAVHVPWSRAVAPLFCRP